MLRDNEDHSDLENVLSHTIENIYGNSKVLKEALDWYDNELEMQAWQDEKSYAEKGARKVTKSTQQSFRQVENISSRKCSGFHHLFVFINKIFEIKI